MGIGLTVTCPCYGSFTLLVGPRIAAPRSCLFPFLCTSCESASTLDVYAAPRGCEHCGSTSVIPYGSPQAVGTLGPEVVFACSASDRYSQAQLTLTDGTYWCPTCRHHTARFSDSGLKWD
jgi:Zn finger protein HypA/HybF involved in hydrogenase expression